MSRQIDERVVSMRFDNAQFEKGVSESMQTLEKFDEKLQFKDSAKGIANLTAACDRIDLSGLTNAAVQVEARFSAMSIAAITFISNIVTAAQNAGTQLVKSLSIDQVTAGFSKYEQKTSAVQTIMNATGKSVEEVTNALEKLQWFSDETSYSFVDMVNNVGKFTSNSIELNTAISAMEGIATAAAHAGAKSAEASRVMYNFSQALGKGYVQQIDWMSIENANMATTTFKQTIIDAALAVGTLIEEEGKLVTANEHNEVSATNFREALKDKWFTKDVLVKALNQYSEYADAVYEVADGYDTASEAMEHVSEKGMELAAAAFKAAQQAKTFQESIDATKDAVSSGWMETFEIIFGNYEESVELWTEFTNTLWDVFASGAEARNELLTEGLMSGWNQFVGEGITDVTTLKNSILEVAEETLTANEKLQLGLEAAAKTGSKIFEDIDEDYEATISDLIEASGGFEKALSTGFLSADILREAIERVNKDFDTLSEEELAAKGYTVETVETFRMLKEAIDEGSISLEDYAEDMAKMSGRENIIQGLRNAYDNLLSVIEPVRDAIRDVFPPMTAEALYNFTEGFKNFTAQFKLSEEAAYTLRTAVKAFLVPIKVLVEVGKLAFHTIGQLAIYLWQLTDSFLAACATGNPFEDLLRRIFGDKLYETGAKIISGAIEKISQAFSFLKEVLTGIIELFVSIKDNGMDALSDVLEKRIPLFEAIGNVLSSVWKTLGSILSKFSPILVKIVETIGDLFSQIGDAFMNADFNKVSDLLNTVFSTGILHSMWYFIDSIADIGWDLERSTNKIVEVLRSVKTVLYSFAADIGAEALIRIATAIGILSAALLVLSLIDSQKMTSGLLAISTLFAELATTFSSLAKIMSGKDVPKVVTLGVALMELSIAILILSSAVKKMASVDFSGMVAGVGGVVALCATLVKTAKALSDESVYIIEGSAGMIGFAVAIRVLASSVKALGSLPIAELGKGLIGVATLCAELALFLKYADFEQVSIGSTASFIALAVAVRILANAVSAFGKLDHSTLIMGLGSVMIVLLELAAFTDLTSTASGVITTALGLVILGGAMHIFAAAIASIGSLDLGTIAKGLAGIAGVLATVILALHMMPWDALSSAASLFAASVALIVLGQAFQNFGSMGWEQIAAGLISLGLSIMILVEGLYAMNGTLTGSAALLVASAALILLSGALKSLGSMGVGEIIKSLITLAGSLAIMGAAAIFLSPVVPVIVALSGAMLLFGAGILALSAGLAGLGTAADVVTSSILYILKSIVGLIPMLIVELGKGIIGVLDVIGGAGASLIGAIATVLIAIGEAIIEAAPTLAQAIGVLLVSILGTLAEYTPQLVEAGATIIISVLQGLGDHLGEFLVAGASAIASFIDGLASGLVELVAAAGLAIVTFLNGIADAIETYLPQIIEAGGRIAAAIIKGLVLGIFGGIGQVIQAIIDLGSSALNAIKEFFGIHSPSTVFEEIGGYLVQGLINGVKNGISSLVNGAIEMGKGFLNAVTDFFGINSPSTVMRDEVGRYLVQGIAEGITNDMSAEEAAAKKAQNIISAFQSEFDKFSLDMTTKDLEYQLWEAMNPNASDEMKAAKKAEFAAKKMESQAQRVLLAQAQYEATLKATGENSEETQKAYNTYLQEQISLAQLAGTVAENNNSAAQSNREAFKAYSQFISENAEAMRAAGRTDEEIKKAAEEMSGWKPGVRTTNVESLMNQYLAEAKITAGIVGDNVEVVIEDSLSSAIRSGASGASGSARSAGSALGDSTIAGFTQTLEDNSLSDILSKWSNKGAEEMAENASEVNDKHNYDLQNDEDLEATSNKTFTSVLDSGIDAFNDKTGSIFDQGKLFIDNLFGGMRDAAGMDSEDGTSTVMVETANTIVDSYTGVLESDDTQEKVYDSATAAFEPLVTAAEEVEEPLVDAVGETLSAAVNEADSYSDGFYQAGENAVMGFVNGMTSDKMIREVMNASRGIGNIAYTSTMRALEEHSPSRKFYKLGMWADQGLANGITDNTKAVVSETEWMCSCIAEAAERALTDPTNQPTITPVVNARQAYHDLDEFYDTVLQFDALGNLVPYGYNNTGTKNGEKSGSWIRTDKATADAARRAYDELYGDPFAGQVWTEDQKRDSFGSKLLDDLFEASQANQGWIRGSDEEWKDAPTQSYSFVQNINSPKAVSSAEVYRDTKNLFSVARTTISDNANNLQMTETPTR